MLTVWLPKLSEVGERLAVGEPPPDEAALKVAAIMSAQVPEAKVIDAVTLVCTVETALSSAPASGPAQPLGIALISMV